MELRRLRLLHELHRLGTVAAVAEALSYSPSSVSVQLAQLEREAQSKLLRRAGRGVELTAAGRRLAEHAAQALAADEAVRTEIATAQDVPRGRVRMTIVGSPALALLPDLLAQMADAAPEVELEVVQRETGPALEELRSRAVDLVVGIEYDPLPVARHRDIDRQDLLREDVLLVLHPEHRALTDDGPVSIAACEHETWASGHSGTGLAGVVRNVCNRLGGFEPVIRHRSDDGIVLGALAASGRAVALLPALLAGDLPQLVARPLREERMQRTIFTAARSTSATAPALVAVRDALQRVAQSLADRPDPRVAPARTR